MDNQKQKRISRKSQIERIARRTRFNDLSSWSYNYSEFEFKLTFAAMLQSFRRDNILSRCRAAAAIGVTPLTLAAWESGRVNPKSHTLHKLLSSGIFEPSHIGGNRHETALDMLKRITSNAYQHSKLKD